MPYNTAAIVPTDEITGAAVLPQVARVKKSINADEDIGNVSAQAAFVICKATELFVQYAAEKSHDIAKSEAKPKRSLTYGHVSNAVARTDNLEFLSDIVPQTTTWRIHKANQTSQTTGNLRKARSIAGAIDPKQTTLSNLAVSAGSHASTTESVSSSQNRGDLSVALNAPQGTVNGTDAVNGDLKKADDDGDVQMTS